MPCRTIFRSHVAHAVLAAVCAGFCVPAESVQAGNASDFQAWLKKHGAYEALDLELADREQTPEVTLERARLLLTLGRAGEALALLRSAPPFPGEAQEHERLWLMGTAARRAGELPEAVAAWSMAAGAASGGQDAERLRGEPGFPAAWQDVCRLWFWRMHQASDRDMALAAQGLLRAALAAGRAVWPEDGFWAYLDAAMQEDAPSGPLSEAAPSPGLTVSAADRGAVARALALFAAGDGRAAQDAVDAVSEENLKQCWKFFFETLTGWKSPAFAAGLRAEGYLQAAAFCEGLWPALRPGAASDWLIPEPLLAHWPRINARLALATPEQAAEIIDTELGGSEIDPLSAERLRQFGLAHALAAGDGARAAFLLGALDPARLALSLKLALVLAQAAQPRDVFPGSEGKPGLEQVRLLAESCGLAASSPTLLPFWTRLTAEEAWQAAQSRPLDPILQLAALDADWAGRKDPALARRLGFLFPHSPTGIQALVMLAAQAGKAGDLDASAAYLNRIDPGRVVGPVRTEWLQAKAALEIELGLDEAALASYSELYRLAPSTFTPAKLLRFALLAQQQEQHELARRVLLVLWRDKDALPPAEQAETLFWLAENAESLGLQSEALRDYLRVAWRYSAENIWAVTALYRAALIYERTGRVEPAKDLLALVVKNADRKSQREQAEQRLRQLEQRGVGRSGRDVTGGAGYPF